MDIKQFTRKLCVTKSLHSNKNETEEEYIINNKKFPPNSRNITTGQ